MAPDQLQPEPPVHRFGLKNSAAVKLHIMSGVTGPAWLSFLWRNWRHIDYLRYGHRVLFLTFMACLNSLLAIPDWLRYHRQVASQQLHAEPVFILGNPRSGTTHLHNLLSLDPCFTFVTTFQAGFPSSFLTLEQAGGRAALQPLLSPTRPMDQMRLTWDLPAEDEIAVNALTGGVSYYAPLTMPRLERQRHRPLLTLEGAAPEDYAQWQDALVWFLRKVTFRDCLRHAQASKRTSETSKTCPSPPGSSSSSSSSSSSAWPGPKPLLLKSPVHTARLRVWRRMFPRAKYVFIHRHPLDVFRSHAHMVTEYFTYCYLHVPTDHMLTDYILSQGKTCHRTYMEERAQVPPGQLLEVRFTEMEADPLATLQRIYAHFGWEHRFESLRGAFEAYCATLSDFKKNDLKPMEPELEAHVRREWADAFKEWGYS